MERVVPGPAWERETVKREAMVRQRTRLGWDEAVPTEGQPWLQTRREGDALGKLRKLYGRR